MGTESKSPNYPNHIGMIMDGNGRWANQRGLSRNKGHQQGVEACQRVVKACQELDVHYLTLYAFSAENWKRPESEVNALMELLELYLAKETKTLIQKEIRLRAIGRLDGLPAKLTKSIMEAVDATSRFGEWNLTLALNYSSRNEMVDASKAIANAVAQGDLSIEDIDWDTFAKCMYTKDLPDPDLIVRTSGETRLSNFLMMQSAYAELIFTETFWPDFTKAHLEECIKIYCARERRYGLTGEQVHKKKLANK